MSPFTPSHRSLSEQDRIARLWDAMAWSLIHGCESAAREFMVLRARRIWGRLGGFLKRSLWAKAWRNAHAIPVFALRWVKSWRVTGR